jgi:hypothetical protein
LTASADGIPEPDLVLYGTVTQTSGNQSARLTVGSLTWTFQPPGGGQPVTVSTSLTNINDQFSYVLRVRCETVMAGQTLSSNVLQIAPASYTYNRAQVFINSVNPATFVQPSQSAVTLSATNRGGIERVDLLVSMSLIDADGDGLPDSWEQQYFGGPAANPNDDPDHDGMSNLAEYKAGTNPTDPNSRFAFIRVERHAASGLVVQWASVQGESYQLQRSADLLINFSTIQSSISATPPANSYHDSTAVGPGPFFYRLRLNE